MSEISPQDLKARLDRGEPPLLLDVRQDWETKLCRLPNAVHIPIEEIELRTEELSPDDSIVVYCHQGVRSAAVAEWLPTLMPIPVAASMLRTKASAPLAPPKKVIADMPMTR